MKENPYLMKENDRLVITEAGHAYLNKIITNTRGPIYAFTEHASPLLTAAAMARLSRRGSDLREIYLDEFVLSGEESASGVIDRVVTGFGDDSVQQLMPISVVVEGASNVLTKKLEWGRFLAYLEQSTRYIYYDQKDSSGRYHYFTPQLPAKLQYTYCETLDTIFTLYSEMVRGITAYVRKKVQEPTDKKERIAWVGATRAQACDAARVVLPAATTSTVGIVGSAQAIESLIIHLASEPLLECREVAPILLQEVRKVAGPFLKRADLPERGGAAIVYRMDTREDIRRFVASYVNSENLFSKSPVELLDYWPKDEFDLIPDMLFSEADISTDEIRKIDKAFWGDGQTRLDVFARYIGNRLNRRHKPGRAFEEPHYKWEITGDYGTFRDLQRHRVVDMFEWQRLTVALGYDIPQLVFEAGYQNMFIKCFELSEKLFEKVEIERFSEEAQYATLLGHKMRYRFIINAREAFHLHELRTGPQGHPGYRKIVQEMHNKLCAVHPNIGRAMKFVNMGEDPELTRMAGELATQRKLDLLSSRNK